MTGFAALGREQAESAKTAERDERSPPQAGGTPSGSRQFLDSSLRLLTDAHRMYAGSNDQQRRLANQAVYTKLTITEDEQLTPTLAEPFATIVRSFGTNGETARTTGKEAVQEPADFSHVGVPVRLIGWS
jgi:hypothetical protein